MLVHGAELTFTLTRFGKPALLYDGYRFNLNNKSTGPRALWTCSRARAKSQCKATVTTFNNQIIKRNDVHHH
ncbi:Modifier of mdg4 [Operophtera brumata]|uniref:Modifier of mdg4 n=1 Tax=Operophtera brumata TaxID=104452 RepID=A0A0L7L7W4_OPEBR|nr:Modifier of mdg4 [Operophtera brumata]